MRDSGSFWRGAHWQSLIALRLGKHALFASEPHTEREPNSDDRNSDKTNSAEAEAERGESAVGPCANLVAYAVGKSVDHTFGFVFVLTPQNREQHFAGRTHESERRRSPQHLKHCQNG